MTLSLASAEEVALFAARRAVTAGTLNGAFVETLRQLCRSDRAAIRDHAVHLAGQAAAMDWARRRNEGRGDAA